VKIEHLRIDGFGKLAGLETGPEPLESLVVVLGPNEAGKSTMFTFLTTALYGFQPASRERNPHVPWGADEAGGKIQVRLADGRCATVERRLRSTPSGTLTVVDVPQDLRNQPLPWVAHVPRTVFRQVFAVTLSELAGLDGDTWARIQDRVLGSMGATDLHSPRIAAGTLEQEAGEIWRPSRRGNQRLRLLRAETRTLRARRHEALERDREIRALVEERENVLVQLDETRRDRFQDKVDLERVQELLPVKRQLDRIAALRIEGGNRDDLIGLPDRPKETIELLEADRKRLTGELDTIEEETLAPTATSAAYDSVARGLLEHEESISRFLSRANAVDPDRLRLPELAAEVSELSVQAGNAAEHLFGQEQDDFPDAPDSARKVDGLSLDLLRDRVDRFEGARRASQLANENQPIAVSSTGGAASGWALPAVLGTAGIAVGTWALAGGPRLAGPIATALVAIAATLALMRRSPARPEASPAPTPPVDRVDESEGLLTEIHDLLDGIPLRPDVVRHPTQGLVEALARLQALRVALREAVRREDAVIDRITTVDSEAQELASLTGHPLTGNGDTFAGSLDRALRAADRARHAAEGAAHEESRLKRARSRLTEQLESVDGDVALLRKRFAALDRGKGMTGVGVAQRRVDAHDRADRLTEELERDGPNIRDLEARIQESEAGGRPLDEESIDIPRLSARLDDLDTAIVDLATQAKALERDAAHLRELETTDAVDSSILSLQVEEAALTRERDRKWVLAQLLREADRSFREEHQPDLIRRASRYLERLTGGRYTGLLIDEQSSSDLFQIVGPGLPQPIALASPISTGTLEQAYLSLRLAIVDHLDEGAEKLPIFVDEAFVNWDEERRDRGLLALSELSKTRQVFAFTCHPDTAARLEQLGGRILRLQR
jgi:uncharacterized protein YhaN